MKYIFLIALVIQYFYPLPDDVLYSWIGAAIGAAASLIGGGLANSANSSANRRSREWTQEQRATAYQTAVMDMRAAGINPMLAYKTGGATAGGATTLPQQNIANGAAQSATAGVNSAQQLRRNELELKLLQQQIDLTRSQEKKTHYESLFSLHEQKKNKIALNIMRAREYGQTKAAELESKLHLPSIDRVGSTFSGLLQGGNSARSLLSPRRFKK